MVTLYSTEHSFEVLRLSLTVMEILDNTDCITAQYSTSYTVLMIPPLYWMIFLTVLNILHSTNGISNNTEHPLQY